MRDADMYVTTAKQSMVIGPAIHPNCAVHQARDRTPAPITAEMMCATAVHKVPGRKIHVDYCFLDLILVNVIKLSPSRKF